MEQDGNDCGAGQGKVWEWEGKRWRRESVNDRRGNVAE